MKLRFITLSQKAYLRFVIAIFLSIATSISYAVCTINMINNTPFKLQFLLAQNTYGTENISLADNQFTLNPSTTLILNSNTRQVVIKHCSTNNPNSIPNGYVIYSVTGPSHMVFHDPISMAPNSPPGGPINATISFQNNANISGQQPGSTSTVSTQTPLFTKYITIEGASGIFESNKNTVSWVFNFIQ